MPNIVEITIKSVDDPAGFASTMARVEALKKAVKDIGIDFGSVSTSQLLMIKQKMQSVGLTDFLGMDSNPGQIQAQLQLLKRMVSSAGLSDFLNFNVNQSQITSQLNKLADETVSIPVLFDVGKIPRLGPTQNISDKFSILGLQAAEQQLAAINNVLAETQKVAAAASASMTPVAAKTKDAGTAAAAAAIPLSTLSFGWGKAAGNAQLFGGILTAVGLPAIFGTVGAVHLLVDSVVEIAGVLIPAGAAFGVFGVAAIPTVQSIYQKMQAVNTTSKALGQNIYPLTGGFSRMAAAAQPGVYQLFGEALVVMNQNSGKLIPIISQVGHVLDTLGARAAVALTSGGFGTFMRDGPKDLAIIGDIIGNIFGTVGNVLRVVPGYAQTIFTALDDVTKAIENVTASPLVQWLLKIGLAGHGFLVWGGLAVTATVGLGNALVGLAARFGLASSGALAFDALAFGAGIKQMIGGVGLLAGELVTLGAGEDIAAAGALTMEGAFAALAAVNPLVWIGLAAAALGGLIFWLTRTTSATNEYNTAVKNALQNAPVSQLGLDLTKQMANTTSLAEQAFAKLAHTQEYEIVTNLHTSASAKVVTQAYSDQKAIAEGYRGELATLQGYQKNYNYLLGVAHGNLGLLTDAGITSNNVIGASSQQLKQYAIEIQAAAAAQEALGLGVGRSAAAQNAQTNEWMTSGLPAMQKVTQAEDALLNVILAGPQAFIGFEQGLNQMAKDAKAAGANIGGLNSQSLTLAGDFYNTAVPAAQKMIDALDQQNISTKDLRTVVATQVGQMLQFTGTNKEARSVLVDLINNALGPGTVSLQTLNTWVKNNGTSLTGMNAIMAKSAIGAGNLTGVLNGLTQQLFAQDLMLANHVTPDTKKYADAIAQNGLKSDAAKAARQQLITDYENTGLSAQAATRLVDGLTTGIKNVPTHWSSQITARASGSGTVNWGTTAPFTGLPQSGGLKFFSGGGMIIGGRPGADSVLVAAMPGEAIVPVNLVPAVAPILAAGGVPGFAMGGLIGNPAGVGQFVGGTDSRALGSLSADLERAVVGEFKQVMAEITSRAHAGPGGGAPLANAMLAIALEHPSPAQWAAWNNVAMAESGWNQFAINPSSGAYGIPQALPFTKMPVAGWPSWAGGSSNPTAQITWMWDYMNAAYGGPIGAWNHEQAFHWYGAGGPVGGGWIGVGDQGRELIRLPGGSTVMSNADTEAAVSRMGGALHITLELGESFKQLGLSEQQLKDIKYTVRVKGGGDVQAALGG